MCRPERRRRMRTMPLGASTELLWSHETHGRYPKIRGADACGLCKWAIGQNSVGATKRARDYRNKYLPSSFSLPLPPSASSLLHPPSALRNSQRMTDNSSAAATASGNPSDR
eukprot:7429918-Pyramimonas_sp.AAC.1